MTAPIIGLTTWRRPIATQLGDGRPTHTLGVEYADAIVAAGGVPVLLPPSAHAAAILDRIDGLVLSGGEDVDPRNYGGVPEPHKRYSADRDAFELELARLARERSVPTLAICRGMQLVNIALGGSLVVDLDPTPVHQRVVDGIAQLDRRHTVKFAEGSRLAAVYGTEERVVNTIHHQAVAQLGDGLRASGAAPDGVIEAIEASDGWELFAVQWHPEKLSLPTEMADEARLFTHFVDCVIAKLGAPTPSRITT